MTLPDELMHDPNGPAYQRAEMRLGPPLDYVAEKLRYSLESQHDLIGELRAILPEDLPVPAGHSEDTGDGTSRVSAKHDLLIHGAMMTFHYQVTAWLALRNMLGFSGPDQVKRLSRMSKDEFEKWLDLIDREGSVSGG